MVFEHLSEQEVSDLFEKFKREGLSDEDAFTEVYSVDCDLDNDYEEEKD